MSDQFKGVILFLFIERLMTIFNEWVDTEHNIPKQHMRVLEAVVLGMMLMFN